jgi:hypothetical protein
VPSDPFDVDESDGSKTFALGDLARKGNLELTFKQDEHADDRAARLAHTTRQNITEDKNLARRALIEDFQGTITYCVIIFGLVTIAAIAGYEGVLSANTPADTQHFCQSLLTAVVSGGISYVVGKNSRGK